MSSFSFPHDGIEFHFDDTGDRSGIPFVFQHGLGGDRTQISELLDPPAGFRLISFDARGHGQTRPLGDPARLNLKTLADDLIASLDSLGLEQAILGGISMGGAMALRVALRHPERVLGLVISQSAWGDSGFPQNLRIFESIASLIRQSGARRGRELFIQSDDKRYRKESPAAANALLLMFNHPRSEETVAKLETVPLDPPYENLLELGRIRVPTLVLAHRRDLLHPFEFGPMIANAIPRAQFQEVASPSDGYERHQLETRAAILQFLAGSFSPTGPRRL